jgi:MFS family permease
MSFMLYATIASVYRIQNVDLKNPLQLVLVGTVLELAVLIFELPSGVLADTYGRRSVIVGFCSSGRASPSRGPADLPDGPGPAASLGRRLHLRQRGLAGMDRG